MEKLSLAEGILSAKALRQEYPCLRLWPSVISRILSCSHAEG